MILQVLGIRWVPLGSQNTFFGVLLTDRLYNLDLPTYPTQDGFQWLKNQGLALGQLLVNCWFGARWFGILGVHPSNNPFHKGIPGIQTTGPQTNN